MDVNWVKIWFCFLPNVWIVCRTLGAKMHGWQLPFPFSRNLGLVNWFWSNSTYMALAAIMPSGHKFVSRSESESTPFESVFFLNSLAVSIKNGTIMITCDLLCLFSSGRKLAKSWGGLKLRCLQTGTLATIPSTLKTRVVRIKDILSRRPRSSKVCYELPDT